MAINLKLIQVFHWGWKLFKVYQRGWKGGSPFLSPVLKKFPDWVDIDCWFESIKPSKLNQACAQIWTYWSLRTLCLHCHLGPLQSTTINPNHLPTLHLLGFAPHHSLSLPSLLVCHLGQSFQLLHTTTFVIFVHAWMTCLGCVKNFQNALERSLIRLKEVRAASTIKRMDCELLGAQIELVCKPRTIPITTIFSKEVQWINWF